MVPAFGRNAALGAASGALLAAAAYALYADSSSRDIYVASSALIDELVDSFSSFGTAAQSFAVACLGLLLFPVLGSARKGSKARGLESCEGGQASTCSSSRRDFQSHHIYLEDSYLAQPVVSGKGGGAQLFRRLRRLLSEGRAKARQLYRSKAGPSATQPGLSRRRSFGGSRSSTSEDVLMLRLSADISGRTKLLGGRKYVPSMSRIASGLCLNELAASEASYSSAISNKRMELLSYNGCQSVDCLAHENTPDAYAGVRTVVTDKHLLQFGALIGEASAQLALNQANSAQAVGTEAGCFFGAYDRAEHYREGWELIIEEHKPNLHYWAWRRYLRKGLYIYKSKTVYENTTPAQLVAFTYDNQARMAWDESSLELSVIPPTAATQDPITPESSCYMYARTKFPPPMASREYIYARRTWRKPDDGGLYCLQRACTHPSPPAATGRVVRVDDFSSGYVIRACRGAGFDAAHPTAEVVSVYFEDSHTSPGITNMGVRRAMWPMVQKAETALRAYVTRCVHGELLASRGPAADASQAAAGGITDTASTVGVQAEEEGGRLRAWWRRVNPNPLAAAYHAYLVACQALVTASGAVVYAACATWRGVLKAASSSLWLCMLPVKAVRALCGAEGAASRRRMLAAFRAMHAPWEPLARRLLRGSSTSPPSAAAAGPCPKADRRPQVLLPPSLSTGALPSPPGASRLQRSFSTGSSGKELSSHPIDTARAKRVVLHVPRPSGAGGAGSGNGTEVSPQGRRREALRRCIKQLVVRMMKSAGAGLLLGQVAKSQQQQQQQAEGGMNQGLQLRARQLAL